MPGLQHIAAAPSQRLDFTRNRIRSILIPPIFPFGRDVAMSAQDRLIHDKPGHLVRRLQQIAVALFMTETKGFDVTPVQYAALLAVRSHPGIDQTALVNIIAFDRSTIGDVVVRLQSKKLVRRAEGARDRRTKVLHITPAGRKLLEGIEPHVQAVQRHLLAPLKPNERAVFMDMMKRLVNLNNRHSRAPLRSKSERGRRKPTPRKQTLRANGGSLTGP